MFEEYFSERIKNTPSSFIRNIFKVLQNNDIISFAGGMPNPISFPQEELKISMDRITKKYGSKLYQYSATLGLNDLREYIAEKYKKKYKMDISIKNVIITTGSQQSIDMIGKTFVNKNNNVMIENPTFLGFLQIFCLYGANFIPIKLENYGLNIENLKENIQKNHPKLAYIIPNFQNPTGYTYTKENREDIFKVIKNEDMIVVQDDAYGELWFDEKYKLPYIGQNLTDKNIYLGSFSKIISPGMRLAYIIAHEDIIKQLETAKQTADAHTNIFSQYLILDYLQNNNLEEHINKIRTLYKNQADTMINSIKKYFPQNIDYTKPKGGMFTWIDLKDNTDILKLFDKAIEKKVAFVPGQPFYAYPQKNISTMRLNYTNADSETIEIGIKRLADAINDVKSATLIHQPC